MHIDVLRHEVGYRRDVANGSGSVDIGLCDVRLLGKELPRFLSPRRMIAVEISDARQAQELVRIVIRLWIERLAVLLKCLDVALQLLPAREAVASGQYTLRIMQCESSRIGS